MKPFGMIPFFIPHVGCPYVCTFCNQSRITGQSGISHLTPEYIQQTIKDYVGTKRNEKFWEVAFYGGSFTAIAKDHSLAIAMMQIYTLHMRRQQAKYRDLLLYGKKGAFYSTLLRLANSYGVEREDGIFIDIALTNQELAEFAATSRESLNRMLSELRKLGYVAYDKHHLVICDFDALIGLLDLEVDNIDPNISNIE